MSQHREAGRAAMAKLTPEERERFARIGGITAHVYGRAHEWTQTTAKAAGRKGGIASGVSRRHKGSDEDWERV